MNSCTFICQCGNFGSLCCHSGRHLNTLLDSLHWNRRLVLSPPIAMLQASDCPMKWGTHGMSRLRGLVQIWVSCESMILDRCCRSFAAELFIRTKCLLFQAALSTCFMFLTLVLECIFLMINFEKHICKCMERWFPKGKICATCRTLPNILARRRTECLEFGFQSLLVSSFVSDSLLWSG